VCAQLWGLQVSIGAGVVVVRHKHPSTTERCRIIFLRLLPCRHPGAGKTTFLTALCGKASYGTLSGSVTINGEPGLLTDAKYKHLVAFVPQEDIMMRDLTVEGEPAWQLR